MTPLELRRPAFRLVPAVCGLLSLLGSRPALATTYQWSGSAPSNTWSTPANWVGGQAPPTSSVTPTDIVYLGSSATFPDLATVYSINSLTFNLGSSGYTFTSGVLTIGAGGLTQSATAAQTFNILVRLSANATWQTTTNAPLAFNQGLSLNKFTLTVNSSSPITLGGVIGGGVLTKTGVGALTLNGVGSAVTALTINDGSCSLNSGDLTVSGQSSLANGGQLNIVGTGKVTSGSLLVDAPTATPVALNLSGGECVATYANVGSGATGVVNQSAGVFTLGVDTNSVSSALGLSSGSSGTYNLLGGKISTTTALIVGQSGSGTFNQYGGLATPYGLGLAGQSGSTGTYNLNGGTLTTIAINGGSGQSNFFFNGGTLQASGDNSAFLQGLSIAAVRQGGAIIDSNGHNVSIAQVISPSLLSGDPTIDGGLTKIGSGVLVLTGANTYRGGTTVKAGTLQVANDSASNTNPLGGQQGAVTLVGGSLVFTDSNVTTARTFNLGAGYLDALGNTITYLDKAMVNGGTLRARTSVLAGGVTLNGTRMTLGVLSQTSGNAIFNNVTLSGYTTYTLTGGSLTTTGEFIATPLTTISISKLANVAGAYLSGAVTIASGGQLSESNATDATTPLYLDGSQGTTINSGGRLSANSGSTIELGGLLTNNGTQTGTLNVNLGGVVQGSGTFGTVNLAANSAFNATGTITGNLFVASGATVSLSGSGNSLTVNGALTNNGVLRFTQGAALTVTSGASNLVNNGTIDIITGNASLPAGFVNNGIVLDSSVTRVKAVARDASTGAVTVSIDGYPGHTYQLQRSASLASGSFANVSGVPAQSNAATNTAATTFAFTDTAPLAGKGFYRVQVDP